jgi:hypothetical protein
LITRFGIYWSFINWLLVDYKIKTVL